MCFKCLMHPSGRPAVSIDMCCAVGMPGSQATTGQYHIQSAVCLASADVFYVAADCALMLIRQHSPAVVQYLSNLIRGLPSSTEAVNFMDGLLHIMSASESIFPDEMSHKDCAHVVLKAAVDQHGEANAVLNLAG